MNSVGRFALRLPVLGWLLNDALNGLPDAKYYFIANCLAVLVACIYFIGYPFVIVLALTGTASALAFLVTLTAADLFSAANRKAREDEKRRPRRAI